MCRCVGVKPLSTKRAPRTRRPLLEGDAGDDLNNDLCEGPDEDDPPAGELNERTQRRRRSRSGTTLIKTPDHAFRLRGEFALEPR